MSAEATAAPEAETMRHLRRQRHPVPAQGREGHPGDLHDMPRIGSSLTCALTGTATAACLGTPNGCWYGNCPGPVGR